MNDLAIATVIGGLTVTGRLTTDHATSSYGQPVFVDDDGRVYNPAEIINITPLDSDDDGEQPSKAEQVYRAVRPLLPSESYPHITALGEAGLLDDLTVEQAAAVVRLMQAAYRKGQAAQGAEQIDSDAVWLDGVGMIERQNDGTWQVTGPAEGLTVAVAAELGRAGGSATSEAKRQAARANGRKGGRPRNNPD